MKPRTACPPAAQLARTPQLAVTSLLAEALFATRRSLRAAHPDLGHRAARGRRPSAEVAKLLLPQLKLLADLLAHYRAVLEAERRHPWAIPPAPPPWKPTNQEPF